MKRFISLAFAAINCVVMVYGQLIPVQNVQSPEIANLGLYGQIPVSLYTGTPDISIPLYELKAGSYTLPISMSYHLASVQPNKQYGVLGMGWNLIAGGYISRIANFIYDEKQNKNGDKYGYYHHHGKMQSVTANGENFDNLVKESITGDNAYDLCADEFYFNFCGYTGHFYLCPDGTWKVISEQDIKLEFDPNNGGFIRNADLYNPMYDKVEEELKFFYDDFRIDVTNWDSLRRNENDLFFNRFTLITPDGCRYEFGGKYATEYSISFYDPNNRDLIPTTWRLAKITTPDNRIIKFNYKEHFRKNEIPKQCDIQYSPMVCITRDYSARTEIAYQQLGWEGMDGYLIFPSILESITAEDEKITFNVEKDEGYNNMFGEGVMFYKNLYGRALFNPYYGDCKPDDQYNVFFNVFVLPNLATILKAKTIRAQIRDQLSSYYLKNMSIETGFGEDSVLINFSYLARNRKMLNKITIGGKAFDESYTSKSYSFNYFEPEKMPDDFVISETDAWGYYRGRTIEEANPSDFDYWRGGVVVPDTITLKTPNADFTKAGVLCSITYPTGGKTHFEYELNDYSKSINPFDRSDTRLGNLNTQLNSNNNSLSNIRNYAGGLRISQIKTIDNNGNILNTKKYYYTSTKDGNESSGILSEVPHFSTRYHVANNNNSFDNGVFGSNAIDMTIISKGGFWPSSLNNNSPIVGYSTVYEETIDRDNQSLGYTKYSFSNYDNDIYGNIHLDENSLHTNFNNIDDSYGSAKNNYFTSRSVERGKLLSLSRYNKNDELQETTRYRYETTSTDYILSTSQCIVTIEQDGSRLVAPLGWLNKIYTYNYLMRSETDSTYVRPLETSFTTRKEYTYNSSNLPSTISELCSDGNIMKTSYLYPADKTEYSWMVDKHNISSVIEKNTSYRGKTKTEKYDYSRTVDTNVPYLKKISTSYDGLNFKTDYETVLVDKYGNPIEIIANGLRSLLYWGINGQLLHGRIDNFSNEQAISLGMMDAVEYSNDDNYWTEAFYSKFFKLPPSAHMYVYNYERRRLLESITEPTGFTTYFKFDGLNRLREVYHYDYEKPDIFTKRFMHLYDYHYIDQHQENE